MTALVWPHYAAVEADGYAVTDDSDVQRTPFDDGLVRQERRHASALTALSITALLADDADYRRFRAWAADCAHLWFAWAAPEDGAGVRHGSPGARARRRGRDPIHGARRRRRPALVGGNAHA